MTSLHRLLPDGSRAKVGDWAECPVWPPDAFAVKVTLVPKPCGLATLGVNVTPVA